MKMKKTKIEIDGKVYEVWGDKPWIVMPVVGENPGRIIIDRAMMGAPDFLKNPLKYNALRRVNTSGAVIPVLFAGDKGRAMADEIAFILNQKL